MSGGVGKQSGPHPDPVHDLVGVGLGPFNLSLAALADRLPGLSALFLEARDDFSWHPGLLMEGTRLQVPFLADLVSLVDPTNPWSFLAYLRVHDRLFPFYFAERWHVPRREYDHYCRWVARSLPSCRFGTRVVAIRWDAARDAFAVDYETRAGRASVAARAVVLGIGSEPVVPEPLRGCLGPAAFHAADYLDRRADLDGARDLTVVGSGQSGAEVFLDLLRTRPEPGVRLRWLTRSPAFAPMEYSQLGLEHFTPDYARYFHGLPPATRDRLVPAQWQLYKAISAETIAEIHDVLYDRGIGGHWPEVTLMPHVAVLAAVPHGAEMLQLTCWHAEQGREFTVETERLVLATGYAPRRPDFLAPISGRIAWDALGRYRVGPDHRVALVSEVGGELYVQNAEMHAHGVGTPDLGLGAYRAATILNAVTRREVYRLPARTAFTTFGVPGAEPDPEPTHPGQHEARGPNQLRDEPGGEPRKEQRRVATPAP